MNSLSLDNFKLLNTTTLTAICKGECKQLFNTKKLECPAGIYVKELFLIMNYQNVDTSPKMIVVQAEIEHILANMVNVDWISEEFLCAVSRLLHT